MTTLTSDFSSYIWGGQYVLIFSSGCKAKYLVGKYSEGPNIFKAEQKIVPILLVPFSQTKKSEDDFVGEPFMCKKIARFCKGLLEKRKWSNGPKTDDFTGSPMCAKQDCKILVKLLKKGKTIQKKIRRFY